MKHEDWEKLDELLGKEGFGGYYDFLELLKDYIRGWYKDKFGMDRIEELEQDIKYIKTLHQATLFLTGIELGKRKVK